MTSLSPMAAYLYGSRGNLCVCLSALCENKEKDDLIRWRMLSKKKKKKKRFRNILLNFFTGWPNFFQSFLFFSIVCTAKQTVFGFEETKNDVNLYLFYDECPMIGLQKATDIFSVGLVQIDWLLTAVITGCSSHVRKSISPIFGGEGFSPVWR